MAGGCFAAGGKTPAAGWKTLKSPAITPKINQKPTENAESCLFQLKTRNATDLGGYCRKRCRRKKRIITKKPHNIPKNAYFPLKAGYSCEKQGETGRLGENLPIPATERQVQAQKSLLKATKLPNPVQKTRFLAFFCVLG